MQHRIITISGATGSGKTSTAGEILKLRSGAKMITSYTTRGPRGSDLPSEYHYSLPVEYFDIEREGFLWVVTAHGETYGTTRGSVLVALELDDPGPWLIILVPSAVEMLRAFVKERTGTNEQILSGYVLSPGETELRRRLSLRADNPAKIIKRLEDARKAAAYDALARQSNIPYFFLDNNEPDTGPEIAARQILSFL